MTPKEWNQRYPSPTRVGFMDFGAVDYWDAQTTGLAHLDQTGKVVIAVEFRAYTKVVPIEKLVVLEGD